MMDKSISPDLMCYISDPSIKIMESGIPGYDIPMKSPGLIANEQYFSNKCWSRGYFNHCHRNAAFAQRWHRAAGFWDGRIVVDIGCGPGNVYASVGGKPAFLLGIDVAIGALQMAQEVGYTPLRADAHHLPLVSGFADIVVINATLHHCDDMWTVLAEAARLVKPGGLLITDHDPQISAYDFRGLGLALWNARVPLYRWLKIGAHGQRDEQEAMIATEIHHNPGDGVEEGKFRHVLEPLGFTVKIYRHNNNAGDEVLDGVPGPVATKVRIAQRLSGIDPDSGAGAITLMCVAQRDVC
jgi:SAM-dependent methyltransferase